jgi:ribosomal protein S5
VRPLLSIIHRAGLTVRIELAIYCIRIEVKSGVDAVGFGLMVPPALHRVFTACGIRDASATIEGSRNPVEVVKCAIQMLHGGVSLLLFGRHRGILPNTVVWLMDA